MARPQTRQEGFKTRYLNAREHLFRAGEKVRRLYLLRTGQLSVYRRGETGVEEIRRVYPGEIIGDHLFLGTEKWDSNVIAILESELVEISLQKAKRQLSSLPEFWQSLFRQVTHRAHRLEEERKTYQEHMKSANESFEARLVRCIEVLVLAAKTARIPAHPNEFEIRNIATQVHGLPWFWVKNSIVTLQKIGWMQSEVIEDMVRYEMNIERMEKAIALILTALRTKAESLLLPSQSESRLVNTLAHLSLAEKVNGKGVSRVWAEDLADEIRSKGFEPDLGQIDDINSRGLELIKLSTENGILIEFQAEDVDSTSAAWELICAMRRAAPFEAMLPE